MDIIQFKKLPIMGILRGITPKEIEPLLDTIIASGLQTIEITMNTQGAGDLIKTAIKIAAGRLVIGAGTVLSVDELNMALDSGASFIVLPTLVKDVVELCRKKNIPVFPGALTPQEVLNAQNAGATMVKVFPSGLFGPKYFKELKGPFNDVQLMAVGGVRPENVAEYFACGAEAVAVGASVFDRQQIEERSFESIKTKLRSLVEAVKLAVC
ncbi:MAG: bifunctional 4-hydroxy-2-oxoglutarate aldolase/2-dehydro-3-deoxy-phosphogluconate aldolase [PVC group bacterium]|nr:bifunctional 4-hydroxy-2-oxoglutarate aldolase/2-dehydro-3-deoxy-phosphogluconate aldolase [PVC group bacterium]